MCDERRRCYPCGSGLARDANCAVCVSYPVDAIASKPAPTSWRSEQPGEQGGNGGFDPQDACSQLYRLQAGLGQQVDFVRDPATFRADVFDYIEVIYNRTRRHSHLGGVSPEAFESASL